MPAKASCILRNLNLYRYCEAAFAATLVDRRHGVIVSSSAFDQTVLIGRARNVGGYSLVRCLWFCSAVHLVADEVRLGGGWEDKLCEREAVLLDFLQKTRRSRD